MTKASRRKRRWEPKRAGPGLGFGNMGLLVGGLAARVASLGQGPTRRIMEVSRPAQAEGDERTWTEVWGEPRTPQDPGMVPDAYGVSECPSTPQDPYWQDS